MSITNTIIIITIVLQYRCVVYKLVDFNMYKVILFNIIHVSVICKIEVPRDDRNSKGP